MDDTTLTWKDKRKKRQGTMKNNKGENHDRTPVDRAFYESLVLHDRWNVGRLYANNIFDGQNFRSQMRHMAEERANELFGMDQEIDDMKRKIEDIIIQKDNLKYLPTEKELKDMRAEKQRNNRVRVIPDTRNQSVIILPPIYKTIPGHQKKEPKNNTKKKRKKPLHAPKHSKSKIIETPRKYRYKNEYDASSTVSAPTSVITSYPGSTRTYYPSSNTRESSSRFPIRESPFKYGSLYGKSSFDIRDIYEESSPNKRSTYTKSFYNEDDFTSTKARYIPKDLRSSKDSRVNFIAL